MHSPNVHALRNLVCRILVLAQLLSLSASASSQTVQNVEEVLALSQPLTMRWTYPSDLTTNLTPTTDGERVYLPLASGLLLSLTAASGELVWKTEIGGELSSSPAADEHAVYVASESGGEKLSTRANGALRALGREGGITAWMRTLPMPIKGTLIENEENLYGGSSDGRVYAIKKRTGDVVWIMQHSAPFASHPTIFGSKLFIGSEDGSLYALDKKTGRVYWRYRSRGAIHGKAVVVDGVVYFGSNDGYVYALRESDGRLRWRRRTGASVQTVAEARAGVLAVSLDNFVYCLLFRNGDRLWKRQLAGRIAAEPLTAADGALFTALSTSTAVILDVRDGKQVNSLSLGAENSITAAPIVAGKVLLVTTRHGLIAFSHPN